MQGLTGDKKAPTVSGRKGCCKHHKGIRERVIKGTVLVWKNKCFTINTKKVMKKNQKNYWLRNKASSTIDPELFRAFILGLLPGFHIPHFISRREATKIARRIEQYIKDYLSAPGIGKAGVALVEHPHDFDEYAAYGAVWMSKDGGLHEREYLINLVCGYLALAVGMPIKVLHNGHVECFHGIFRKINAGAGIHVDIVSADSDAFRNRVVIFQASVVLHLLSPVTGGETVIWDRRAEESDKRYLLDDWQYDPKMLANDANLTVPCIAGNLVILPTINYHMVKPSPEGSSRISFSLFTVVFEDEPGTLFIYN